MKPAAWLTAVFPAMSLAIAACTPVSEPKMARSSLPRETQPGISGSSMEAFTSSNNAFAVELYGSLRDRPGNLVFSPYSLSAALAMAYAGARGETEAQMARTLHFDLPQAELHPAFNQLDLVLTSMDGSGPAPEGSLELRIANALWADEALSLLEDYLDVLARNYGSGIQRVDFRNSYEPARQQINTWVNRATEKRIENLVPKGAIDHSTRMVLVNAIYFYGDWQRQFDANDTRLVPFKRLDGSQVEASMMHAHLTGTAYVSGDGYQAVELPYQGGNAVMDIIVPDEDRFAEFEAQLEAVFLSRILGDLRPTDLQLGLPKFEFGASLDAGDQLSALGMPNALDPALADFSGMTGARDLYVSKVLQQAFVAVDERGTEAAAATAVIIAPTSIQVPQLQLIVNRPFIFAIRDVRSGQILFLGRVLDPTD